MKPKLSTYRTQLNLFLTPYLIGLIVLFLIPAITTVIIAFTEYNAIAPPRYVGLGNFYRMFTYDLVNIALKNTLIFVVLAVPLRLIAAISLALLLQRNRRFFGAYRAAVYLPTVIPEAAYALIWLWLFNPLYGPLNTALALFGINAPAWLVEAETARIAIVILSTFQVGEGFIVLLAALQNVPRNMYEAARVDGASTWQSFWRITFPLILPWLLLLTFRDLIVSLQNTFTPSFIVTYGGPYYATTFIPLLIYEIAFDFFDFGLASALLILVFTVTGGIIWIINKIARSRIAFDEV